MARAFLLVMDSVGIGGAPDADRFGDEGANTVGHIAAACVEGRCAHRDGGGGPLRIPNLLRLGLSAAAELATGEPLAGLPQVARPEAIWGVATETSKGKDTITGHWELAGAPVAHTWGYFPDAVPAFPTDLTEALIAECDLPGILGDCHASGIAIIEDLGEAHIRTGKPICYTSVDSVFQIAAHETHFGLERLYAVCDVARRLCDRLRIGRVIARPFSGETRETFARTGNRRDYAVPPPHPTLLDLAAENGRQVIAVGKIADIFAHRGVTTTFKAPTNPEQFARTLEAEQVARNGDLVVTNFIDFDQVWGHRRDPCGYAACLEAFDAMLPRLIAKLRPGDLVVLTADHGNDPTFKGTDHTRERVPVLAFGPGIEGRPAGHLRTFADVGQTIAAHLALPTLPVGASFL